MISIVEAMVADVALLVPLCRESFYDAWTLSYDDDDIYSYMDKHFTDENLRSEILNTNESYYIAYEGETPAGYLKLRKDPKEENPVAVTAIELQRLYIQKDFQRKGIGTSLIAFAIETAGRKNFEEIWLGVWEKNTGAIKLYKSFGFEFYGEHYFVMGNDRSLDLLMKKKL